MDLIYISMIEILEIRAALLIHNGYLDVDVCLFSLSFNRNWQSGTDSRMKAVKKPN